MKYYKGWPKIPAQEKGIDARIVQDILVGAVDQEFDVAILLSGDQDFRDVVSLLGRRFPVSVETYYPASRRHLYEVAKAHFAKAEVIDKRFYNAIKDVPQTPPSTSLGSIMRRKGIVE